MVSIYLLERLQLLLNLAKDPLNHITARENLAAARELVDTAFMLEAISKEEFRSYRLLCATASLVVSNAELARAQAAAPKIYEKFSDGVRAVKVTP